MVHLFVIRAFWKQQCFEGLTVCTVALTDIEPQESCVRETGACSHLRGRSQSNYQPAGGWCSVHPHS